MAHVDVFIKNGMYNPPLPSVGRGDTVTFRSFENVDIVLCIEEGNIFGASRFVIPAGHNLRLIVQDFMPVGRCNCAVQYSTPGEPLPDCPADLADPAVSAPLGLQSNPPD